MLSQYLIAADTLQQPWLWPLALCLACAGLVGLSSHFLTRRSRRRPEPVLPVPSPARPLEESDPDLRFVAGLRQAPVAVLVSDAAARVEPVWGWVVQRCTAGVRLELEEEGQVDPQTVLSIRPTDAAPEVPWVQVEVRRCRARQDVWHLDCRYVRTPPYSVRMLFG